MSNETSPPGPEQVSSLMAHVFALVRACPAGRVTTYGWIGKALGYPRGARMIGWFMSEAREGVPAQRVISSKGELTGSRAADPLLTRAASQSQSISRAHYSGTLKASGQSALNFKER